MIGLKAPHQLHTAFVVNDADLDAVRAEEFLVAAEGAVFADDDTADLELDDRAAAHHARAQRRNQGQIAVASASAGVAQAVHFPVGDRVAVLHPAIVPDRDDAAVFDERGADRDAALGGALLGLRDRRRQRLGLHCRERCYRRPLRHRRSPMADPNAIIVPWVERRNPIGLRETRR